MMVPGLLAQDEKALLLKLARQALTAAVNGQALPPLDVHFAERPAQGTRRELCHPDNPG